MQQLTASSDTPMLTVETLFNSLSPYLGRYIRLDGLGLNSEHRWSSAKKQRAAELIGVYDNDSGNSSPDEYFVRVELKTGGESSFLVLRDATMSSPEFSISVLTDGSWVFLHGREREQALAHPKPLE